ncbi:unnamed protein product, partial [Ixodes hexagonus]
TFSVCVLIAADAWRHSDKCGRNEVRAWFFYQRDRLCDGRKEPATQVRKQGIRCVCKSGYFRGHDGSCYPMHYCRLCRRRSHETFSPCVSDCMQVCGESDIQQCSTPCKIGCECKRGYIR